MSEAKQSKLAEKRGAGQVNRELEKLEKEIAELETLIGTLRGILHPIMRETDLEKVSEEQESIVPLANQIRIQSGHINHLRMDIEQILGAIEL